MLRRIMAGLITLICAVCWQAAHAQITEPKIMPRKSWETKKAATDRMLAQAPPYKGIVIHNTAASQAKLKANKKLTTEQRIRNIQNGHQTENFHKYRPEMKGKTWGDFAYHYYIAMDGQIAETRSIGYEGDSGTRYNMTGQLLIVLEGNFDEEHPARAQLASLDTLVAWLAAKYGLSAEQIKAHDDLAPMQTSCPGVNLKSYMDELRKKTTAALKKG